MTDWKNFFRNFFMKLRGLIEVRRTGIFQRNFFEIPSGDRFTVCPLVITSSRGHNYDPRVY